MYEYNVVESGSKTDFEAQLEGLAADRWILRTFQVIPLLPDPNAPNVLRQFQGQRAVATYIAIMEREKLE